MKVASKLAVLLGLGAFVPFVSAKSLEQAYLDSCRKGPGVPVPVAVVSPRVWPGTAGDSVSIEFTVETSGKPSGFSVLSTSDSALADAVVDAVKQWQFTPAQRGGVPVATKVILPVRVVANADATGYASE